MLISVQEILGTLHLVKRVAVNSDVGIIYVTKKALREALDPDDEWDKSYEYEVIKSEDGEFWAIYHSGMSPSEQAFKEPGQYL